MTPSPDLLVNNEPEVSQAPERNHDPAPPEYRLQVSRDRVRVLLDCPDPHSELESWAERIAADFQGLEIPEYPDREQIIRILAASCSPGQHLHQQPIMMGAAPIPTRHGRLEWARDFFAAGWEEDPETEALDYWEKRERRSVKAGELLVHLHHPVEGTPGLSVYGTEIPVAKAEKAKLRAGKHVQTKEVEGGLHYIATCNGRVRHMDGMISVDDVYVIKGDVSLDTGNIHHTGAVMIQGDVGCGATVEADGEILVKGMLEPCHIRCGGDLTVAGGIVSEEGYQIEVKGNITARYISEATIQAGGDILVTNEISHSRILCSGGIKAPRGRIAGGLAMAFKGICVGEAGSSTASDTRLVAGMDHTLDARLGKHEKQILKLEKARESAQAVLLRSLKKLGQKKRDLTAEEIKTLNKLKRRNSKLVRAIAESQNTIQKLKAGAAREGRQEVVILKELWSGTTIQLGKTKTLVKRSIMKPRMVRKCRSRIEILPLGEDSMPGEGNMPDED